MIVFLLLLTCGAAQSAPRVILILCDGLTIDDLRDNRYPQLYQLAENSAIGLMNVVSPGPQFPGSALLTLAVGEQQPAEPTDAQAFRIDEPVPGDRDSAGVVYTRRTGAAVPIGRNLVHLGIAGLTRRGLNGTTLGAILADAHPPIRALIVGNAEADQPERAAALLTLDRNGLGSGDLALPAAPDPLLPFRDADAERLSRYAVEADAGLFVIRLGDMSRVEAARARFSPADYQAMRRRALMRLDALLYLLQTRMAEDAPATDLILVSPVPPSAPGDLPWRRLTPVLARGPDFPPGLLASATTRTDGLSANIDVAPTVLSLLHVPIPATMVGRPMRVASAQSGPERLALLARADFVALLNARAMTQAMIPLGGLCLLLTLTAVAVRRRWGAAMGGRFAPGLILTLNLPLALLFSPILIPPTLLEYGLRIAAWMAGLTAACYLLARPLRMKPPVVAALLCLVAILADTLTGQTLIKQALLSGYALSGIRYYGVGNEYLGVLLGMTLAGGFAWLDDRKTPFPPMGRARGARFALFAIWLGTALVLGWPSWGANAGSLIVSTAGFGVGLSILRGRKPTLWLGVACALAGLLAAFFFGALDARFSGANSSHAGAVLTASTHGRGAAYLVEIALRKLAMNLRLLQSPYLLLSAAVVTAVFLAARRLLGPQMQDLLSRRPWTAHSLPALLTAGAASLLFKDSGVVTAVFLAGASCLILLWYTVAE